jgi:hypothetical protein
VLEGKETVLRRGKEDFDVGVKLGDSSVWLQELQMSGEEIWKTTARES